MIHTLPSPTLDRAALLLRQRPPAYDLRCARGHGDLSSHMKPGDACRWLDGDEPCGSKLRAVVK